jgi:paraquat-inducible protein B
MSDTPLPPTDDLPEAVPDPTRRKRLPFAFLLPAIVIVVAGIVVIQQQAGARTQHRHQFLSADGLEVNKTKIRYKDVDIGDVTDIHVSKDRKKVVVTARMHRDASDYLVDDTRFWVVRPRVAGGSVTGLGTWCPAPISASMSAVPTSSAVTSTASKYRPS